MRRAQLDTGGLKVIYATPDHRNQRIALAKKVLFSISRLESKIQTQAQGFDPGSSSWVRAGGCLGVAASTKKYCVQRGYFFEIE